MFRLALTVALALALPGGGALGDVIDGEELVDPTRPLVRPPLPAPDQDDDLLVRPGNILPGSFELSFVRVSSSPMAVINDRRVTLGDTVGGAEVVAIDRSGVTLRINDEETRINLYGSGVKSAARTQ